MVSTLIRCFPIKYLRWAVVALGSAILIFLPISYAHAFTPGIQAAIFNASMKKIRFTTAEIIINKTKSLYSSLNSDEQLAMYGHGSLKIASYMFLVDFWREYSLQRVLAERGFHIKPEELMQIGVDQSLYSTPMKYIGALNYSINENCSQSENKPFTYNYLDLIKTVQALQPAIYKKEFSDGAQAALFFIKVYYYQKLHVANSTHTYTNDSCVSDSNGMLSCVSSLLAFNSDDEARLEVARQFQHLDWKDFNISPTNQRRLQSCPLTVWHYLSSGALSEPLNDGEIVSASEALIYKTDQKVMSKSERFDINSIMQDNHDVMTYLYYDSGAQKDLILKGVILTQMQIAAMRSVKMIEIETFGK